MSRDYFAVFAVITRRAKFRKLSTPAKAALWSVLSGACYTKPEATWHTREDLEAVLEADGHDPILVDEFLRLGWIDRLPDGALGVHDWDEWQVAMVRSGAREYEAHRKREWRRQVGNPPLSHSLLREQKRGEERSPGHVPDMSRTSNGGRVKNVTKDPGGEGTLPIPVGLPSPEEAARRMAEIRANLPALTP